MKEIAHSYVAERVTGAQDLSLYVGCLLPDLAFYTLAGESLESAHLHGKGAEKFYHYLKKKAPADISLALGVLAHGTLYGADRYNDREYKSGPGYAFLKNEPLIDDVKKDQRIPRELAAIRAHNFIELGMDLLISQKEPDLVKRIGQALRGVDIEKVAGYIAECFQKDRAKIIEGSKQILSVFQAGDLISAEGLAKIWAQQAVGLPEQDRVNVEKATLLIRKATGLIKDDYEEFLDFTILEVRKNLRPFLRKS